MIEVEDRPRASRVVVQLVEDGKRLLGLLAHGLDVDAVGAKVGAVVRARRRRREPVRQRLRQLLPLPSPRAATASARSVLPVWKSASERSGMSSRPQRAFLGQERERAVVEVHGRRPVAAHEGPAARGGEQVTGPGGEGLGRLILDRRARPGSGGPARGGRRGTPRPRRPVAERALEPGGVALVQVGARLLGEARVGGVADEGVAEAERLLPRKGRELRADELLAHEAHKLRRDRVARLGDESSTTAPTWKISPSTEARSMHAALLRRRGGRGARRAAPGSPAARRSRRCRRRSRPAWRASARGRAGFLRRPR